MITGHLLALQIIDGASPLDGPPTPTPDPYPQGGGWGGGGGWIIERRRVRLPDGSETDVDKRDIPALIERIEQQAENSEDRRAAVRASLELSKTQPVIDLDAPWAREMVARVLAEYLAEREFLRLQRQRADDDALILLLM